MATTYLFEGLFDGKIVKTHTGTLEEVKEAAGFGISPSKEAELLQALLKDGLGEFTEEAVPEDATQQELDFIALLGIPRRITTRISEVSASE